MPAIASPPPQDSYKTRIEISRDGQNTLYAEQARRQLSGERITLLELASEITEQALHTLRKEHLANPVN